MVPHRSPPEQRAAFDSPKVFGFALVGLPEGALTLAGLPASSTLQLGRVARLLNGPGGPEADPLAAPEGL